VNRTPRQSGEIGVTREARILIDHQQIERPAGPGTAYHGDRTALQTGRCAKQSQLAVGQMSINCFSDNKLRRYVRSVSPRKQSQSVLPERWWAGPTPQVSAGQAQFSALRLLRRCAPRNDRPTGGPSLGTGVQEARGKRAEQSQFPEATAVSNYPPVKGLWVNGTVARLRKTKPIHTGGATPTLFRRMPRGTPWRAGNGDARGPAPRLNRSGAGRRHGFGDKGVAFSRSFGQHGGDAGRGPASAIDKTKWCALHTLRRFTNHS
jgi:hypothetical protein